MDHTGGMGSFSGKYTTEQEDTDGTKKEKSK
jgi:hypothetical protein